LEKLISHRDVVRPIIKEEAAMADDKKR